MKEAIIQYNDDPNADGDHMVISWKELVRCKDCVNSGTSRCPCHYSGDPYIDWEPDGNWFCADGKRE